MCGAAPPPRGHYRNTTSVGLQRGGQDSPPVNICALFIEMKTFNTHIVGCVELLLMCGKHLWTEVLLDVPVSLPEEHLSELSADVLRSGFARSSTRKRGFIHLPAVEN